MIKVREIRGNGDETFQNESAEEFSIELRRLGTLEGNTHIGYDDDPTGLQENL